MSADLPPLPARIETAEALLAALASPELRMRVAVIVGIAKDPRAALALGRHEGRDVIDALVAALEDALGDDARGSALAKPLAKILTAYADPRVERLFCARLETWREFELVEVAADYLARTAAGLPQIRALLAGNPRPHHAQAAARALLAVAATLSPRERLRCALLAGAPPPAVDDETAAAWLDELAGPLRLRALAHAAKDPGALALLAAWDRLDDDARAALLGLARRLAPSPAMIETARAVLPRALASGTPDVVVAAFAWLAALGSDGESLRPPLSAFLGSADASIVCAALSAARLDTSLDGPLSSASDVSVRCAALRRLAAAHTCGTDDNHTRGTDDGHTRGTDDGHTRGTDDGHTRGTDEDAVTRTLVAALADDAWPVRAVAAGLLSARGAASLPAVRPLAEHPDPAVRLAAAQVILALAPAAA